MKIAINGDVTHTHLRVSSVGVVQKEVDVLISQGEEAYIEAVNQDVEDR